MGSSKSRSLNMSTIDNNEQPQTPQQIEQQSMQNLLPPAPTYPAPSVAPCKTPQPPSQSNSCKLNDPPPYRFPPPKC